MKGNLHGLKIETTKIKNRVNDILNAGSSERNAFMKYKRTFKTVIIAAAIMAVTLSVSAFVASPAGQNFISNIVSYFDNDKATEITSIGELGKYGVDVGKSVSKDGFTVTLDGVSADDNFVHVFYTIKSEKPFYDKDETEIMKIRPLWVEILIDGKLTKLGNHDTYDKYFVDNYTYRVAEKINVAYMELGEKFTLELFADSDKKKNSVLNKLYDSELSGSITDEEKESVWHISYEADKSASSVESKTYNVNKKFPASDAALEKIVISPFGNQFVLSTPACNDEIIETRDFALFDENGVSLDVLNIDLAMNADGSSKNAFEFLKADNNTKHITFVPLTFDETHEIDFIENETGTYPIEYKVNDYGKVVVTDIRIADGLVEIDYYYDGFVWLDPGFLILDKNGENAQPGGKLGCTVYTEIHYDTNTYTAKYVYENYDENGNHIALSEKESGKTIREKFTTLGVWDQSYIKLDFDNAMTVNLD